TSRSGFSNGSTDGLVRIQGSKGSGIALAKTVGPKPGAMPIVASGNRSGTTATYNTVTPHGLSVGDPVWITVNMFDYALASGGQAVFYTFRQDISFALAKTSP